MVVDNDPAKSVRIMSANTYGPNGFSRKTLGLAQAVKKAPLHSLAPKMIKGSPTFAAAHARHC